MCDNESEHTTIDAWAYVAGPLAAFVDIDVHIVNDGTFCYHVTQAMHRTTHSLDTAQELAATAVRSMQRNGMDLIRSSEPIPYTPTDKDIADGDSTL